MTVVTVDERGRMTIPKEIGVKERRAIIILAGSFFVVIPLPGKPHGRGGSWLISKRNRKELKALAEEFAGKDAVKRARSRKQI